MSDIADPTLRDKLARITYYLTDLSRGMGRIQQGLVPDGSGDPISSIADDGLYLKLLGRPGNQDAHGGTGPAGTLTLSSTTASTKGLIYLGDAKTSSYDEVNERLGLGTSSPAAKVHIKQSVGGGTQTVHPSNVVTTWGIIGGGTAVAAVATDDGDTNCLQSGKISDVSINNLFKCDFTGLSDPGVDTGHALYFLWKEIWDAPIAHGITDVVLAVSLSNGSIASPGSVIFSENYTVSAYQAGSIDAYQSWTRTLTTGEAASISSYSSLFVTLQMAGCGNSDPSEPQACNSGQNTTRTSLYLTEVYFSAPGYLDPTPLQRWSDVGGDLNDLNYVADSAAATTLQLSGTPKFRITSGLELAIGSPTVSAVWTASDTDGTGAWAASGGSIYLDHGSSIYWRNLANTAYLRMLNSDSGDNFWVGREANDSVFIYASGAQQMRIRSNGVTIGSGSVPRGRLDVVGGSITIDNGQTVQMRNFANTAFINTFKTDTSDNLYFGGDTDMGDLFLSDNVGLEALRVNAAYVRIYNNLRTYGGITQFGTATGALTLQAPATITTHTLTLPSAQGGASTVLTNDGAGALSWSSSASGLATKIQHRFVANGPYRIDGDVDGAMIAQRAMTLTKFNLYRRLGGTSGSTAVDLRNNGATVLSTVPGIAFNAGASATASGIIGTAAVAAGDRITVSASAVDGGRPYDWVALVEGY